jgi:hypothetical protein
MPKRHSELLNTTLAVYGADREFALDACVHLASVGARLFLSGDDEQRLLEVDLQLSQSEIHRVLPEQDPMAIASALFEAALPLSGVIAFVDTAPDEATCRHWFTPLLQRLDRSQPSIPALIVHATRPATAHAELPTLPDLTLGALRVSWISARSVTSSTLLQELTQTATASGRPRDEHLAELFGGTLPKPILTGLELGGFIETLLGSFSRFSRERHYRFDGAASPLLAKPVHLATILDSGARTANLAVLDPTGADRNANSR